SSYARTMIELRTDVEFKDTIMVAMPKLTREGFYTCTIRIEYEWKPPRYACLGFKPAKEYRPVSKKPISNTIDNKKNVVKPTKEVTNSNPFDLLNLVDNDEELGTNWETSNLANNEANSSGSFWNVETSSTSTTPIINKTRKIEKLIIDGNVTLVDDDERVGFRTQSLLEQWMDSYNNCDYDEDPYDDDMYEGQDLPKKLQEICYNLDI
nr:hypothetical protein [Tanacetum cinerariifolium]